MTDFGTRKAIALFLRNAMKAQNLSQLELAEKSGVGQSHISRLLNEQASPSAEMLEKLGRVFGVTASYLLLGATAPVPAVPRLTQPNKRRAQLIAAFEKCDEPAQRLLIELAKRLSSRKKGENDS